MKSILPLSGMRYLALMGVAVIIFTGCNKEAPTVDLKETTTIIYMAADNNLRSEALDNINDMEEGYSGENNLLVYIDTGTDQPKIIKIEHDTSPEVVSKEVKIYEDLNSASPTVMKMVLNDIINLYPANSYGLTLWSHGTSWWPSQNISTKSFGLDGTSEIDILELNDALPIHFDYIIFDACLMGGVEVVSQLKNCTDYIVAAPTETLADGFPYLTVVPILLDDTTELTTRLKNVCSSFMEYYRAQNGDYKSATISLISTSQFDLFTSEVSSLLEGYPIAKWDYGHDEIQRLDVYNTVLTFDFMDFLEKNYPLELLIPVETSLEKMILYKDHTDSFIGLYDITKFCGISCYVPRREETVLNDYYRTLSWSIDSNFIALLD